VVCASTPRNDPTANPRRLHLPDGIFARSGRPITLHIVALARAHRNHRPSDRRANEGSPPLGLRLPEPTGPAAQPPRTRRTPRKPARLQLSHESGCFLLPATSAWILETRRSGVVTAFRTSQLSGALASDGRNERRSGSRRRAADGPRKPAPPRPTSRIDVAVVSGAAAHRRTVMRVFWTRIVARSVPRPAQPVQLV
jgi:hypothetical protein